MIKNYSVPLKISEELAEILSMFAADGCLQEDYICMWGNITEDKDYYNIIVCPLFSKVFQRKIIAHEKKSNSVYGFYLCSKEIVKFFKELGFTRNKTYTVKVPEIIFKSDNLKIQAAFIRGFLDCDGHINFLKRNGKYCLFKRKFNTYPRIEVSVVSEQIIDDIRSLLDKLEIKHTKHIQKNNQPNRAIQYKIVIRGIERTGKWMKLIGFNNPAQFTKYLIWKRFGFCPARTTIKQRKLILKNKISPKSFYEDMLPTGFEPVSTA